MPDRRGGLDMTDTDTVKPPLDLSNRVNLRAEIARAGLHALSPYESPDRGWWTNPLNDPEVQQEVRSFMDRLWKATFDG